MDGELTCGICLELFDNPLMLPCSHNFCKKCLAGIIDGRSQFHRRQTNVVIIDCPLCQRHIFLDNGIDSAPFNRTLENIVEFRKSKGVLPFGDVSWNTDSNVTENTCRQHDLPMSFHCQSCNISVCKECSCFRQDKGAMHRCVQIKELSKNLQAKISSSLTEINKKSGLLNDRVQLLQDMLAEIDANEKKVEKLLELEISALVTRLKGRQVELSRVLHNDFESLKCPVSEQLQKLKMIQRTVEEHLKRLSMVKATRDLSLRVKLMQDSERQLSSLLCFDLAWFTSHDTPTVDMPDWSVDKEEFEASMEKLIWKQTGTSSTKQNHVAGSKNDNVRVEDQAFMNFFGGRDSKKNTDDDMMKLSAAPGLATFLKNDVSSTRNTSSSNSIKNIPTVHNTQQNIAGNSVPTSVSLAQTSSSIVQSSSTTNIAFPILTSADFLPAQNKGTNDQSGKSQGRLASKPSAIQNKLPNGSSNIKLSMENQVSSFSKSGFNGNILQKSNGHRDSGLAKSKNGQQASASLSGTLECLSLTDSLSSTSSTSILSGSTSETVIPKFLVSDSTGQSNIGTSSNFLFSTATPFPLPAVPAFKQSSEQDVPHNIEFKQPSFIGNSSMVAVNSEGEGSVMKTSTPQAGSATMANFKPIFSQSVNMSSFTATLPDNRTVTSNIGSSLNQNSLIMPAFGTSVPITVSTNATASSTGSSLNPNNLILPAFGTSVPITVSTNATASSTGSSLNQNSLILPAFGTSVPITVSTIATASSTSLSQSTGNNAIVNHDMPGVSSTGHLKSNFPTLTARDFSPSRDAGSSQKPSIRRILKSKKMVKK